MRTAQSCIQEAERIEALAGMADTQASRGLLMETAKIWRALAIQRQQIDAMRTTFSAESNVR